LTVRFGAGLPLKAAITASSSAGAAEVTPSGIFRGELRHRYLLHDAVGLSFDPAPPSAKREEHAATGPLVSSWREGAHSSMHPPMVFAVDGDGVAVEASSWTSPHISSGHACCPDRKEADVEPSRYARPAAPLNLTQDRAMGLYQRWIVPRLIDLAMAEPQPGRLSPADDQGSKRCRTGGRGGFRPEPAALQVGGRPRSRDSSLGSYSEWRRTGSRMCRSRCRWL
jgi:hypothetical protein